MAAIFSPSHFRISNPQPGTGKMRCRLGFFIKCDRFVEITFLAVGISQRRIEVNVVWIKLNRTLRCVHPRRAPSMRLPSLSNRLRAVLHTRPPAKSRLSRYRSKPAQNLDPSRASAEKDRDSCATLLRYSCSKNTNLADKDRRPRCFD